MNFSYWGMMVVWVAFVVLVVALQIDPGWSRRSARIMLHLRKLILVSLVLWALTMTLIGITILLSETGTERADELRPIFILAVLPLVIWLVVAAPLAVVRFYIRSDHIARCEHYDSHATWLAHRTFLDGMVPHPDQPARIRHRVVLDPSPPTSS